MLKDFKEFISRGNVVDLAVGVMMGSAFGKIVSSLVDDIIMPLVGVIIGGIDFSDLTIEFKNATINYGMFIQNIVDFLIIAICIFFFVRIINRLTSFRKKEEVEVEEAPKEDSDEVKLLKEINANLVKLNKNNKKTDK